MQCDMNHNRNVGIKISGWLVLGRELLASLFFQQKKLRKHEIWSLETTVQVLVLLMMNRMTLGKTFNFSEMDIGHPSDVIWNLGFSCVFSQTHPLHFPVLWVRELPCSSSSIKWAQWLLHSLSHAAVVKMQCDNRCEDAFQSLQGQRRGF